jgi:hypothetical protein
MRQSLHNRNRDLTEIPVRVESPERVFARSKDVFSNEESSPEVIKTSLRKIG